jgi:hypothetical protein
MGGLHAWPPHGRGSRHRLLYQEYPIALNEEDDGITYAAQYFAISLEQLEAYQEHFAPALLEEMNKKFQGNFVSFRTVLEVVE